MDKPATEQDIVFWAMFVVVSLSDSWLMIVVGSFIMASIGVFEWWDRRQAKKEARTLANKKMVEEMLP